jgi:hypothetical protein
MGSDLLTRTFLAAPWLVAPLWLVLHGADWTLTLKGARMRRALFAATGVSERSAYELNPFFRADVSQLRFFAPRFVATWLGFAVLLPGVLAAVARLGLPGALDGFATWIIGASLGMLVFTRLSIIGRHLRNVFLFSRLLRPPEGGPPQPFTQLGASTNLYASAIALAEAAALVGVAAALSLDPWVTGGAAGLGLLAAKHLVLALGAPRSA